MKTIQEIKDHVKEHEADYVATLAVGALIGTSAGTGYFLGKCQGFNDGARHALDVFEYFGKYSSLPTEFVKSIRRP